MDIQTTVSQRVVEFARHPRLPGVTVDCPSYLHHRILPIRTSDSTRSKRSKTEQELTPNDPYLWYDSLRPFAKFRCCFAGLRSKCFGTELTAVIAEPAVVGTMRRSAYLPNILASGEQVFDGKQVFDVEPLPISVTETASLAAAKILTPGGVLLGPNVVGDCGVRTTILILRLEMLMWGSAGDVDVGKWRR
ncbi:MAG: hypothetical protein FRX48_01710 [Lasallia pustulata]|uniref:Uncharacterized protein n=1 Tax=Lasallia pustulata TaxID=136370 RepID=A0A5M8PYT1_9LECA|nr:MAG: hypothetical protein FRX48_01710 [Lasallia pustulata]